MKSSHVPLAIVAACVSLSCFFGIIVLGAGSRRWGDLTYRNATDRDVWISAMSPGGLGTFEAVRVPAHGSGGIMVDRPEEGELWELTAYETDPGPVRPNVSTPIPPLAPVARLSVPGGSLLRTRAEGSLEIVFATVGGRRTLRIGGYAPRKG